MWARLLLALVLGSPGALAQGPGTPTPLDLIGAGAFGDTLEDRPAYTARAAEPRRIRRPRSVTAFEPAPTLRELRLDAGDLRLWLHGARPRRGAAFAFDCPVAAGARLQAWVFTGARTRHPYAIELQGGGTRLRLQVPGGRPELRLYDLPVGEARCEGGSLELAVASPRAARGLVLGEPVLVEPGPGPPTPVILISLDTLRRDAWEGSPARPASLEAFRRDALRYPHAFTSFPTTPEAHSELFAGRYFDELLRLPLDDALSFASRLRDAGYSTLAFVAGGYVRAGFGFGVRPPGFALGFDLYVEGLQLEADKRPPGRTGAVEEGAYRTRTLGASLERSLRWLAAHPHQPTFHFVHGYDVHEYRTAERRYWDAALGGRGLDPGLDGCVGRLGVVVGEREVVHHPFAPFLPLRTQALGEDRDCHRRVASLMYEARVRSAEDAVARYLDGLRELGLYERALIVLTSDHGEVLLDETAPGEARPWWGHNKALARNLEVPLWIKRPGPGGRGRAVSRAVGLVDLRATLADLLDLELGDGIGASALPEAPPRAAPIRFSSLLGGRGLVLEGGGLCRRMAEGPFALYTPDAGWRPAGGDEGARCQALAAGTGPDAAPAPPPIPPELREELRALGYVE